MDLTTCPECGHLAEVEWRDVLDSTDGPVEHARIRCIQRHWFLLPVERLDTSVSAAEEIPVVRPAAASRRPL
jgi:hypothetical protein